jgi:small-conductance mechanosensitive channel
MMLIIIGYSITMESFESKFLPLVICGILLILAIAGLRKEILKGHDQDETLRENENAGIEDSKENKLGGYLIGGGCVLGFSVAVYIFGFLVAIPLFIIFYLKTHETGWLVTILYAAIITVIIYAVFELGLDIVLYRGVLLALIIE